MALSKIDVANMVENQMPQANLADNINFRNIVINGDMSIAQRATSASSITSTGYHTIDRWNWQADYGTVTLSQSTDVPTGQGFAKSFKADVTTAGTVTSGGTVILRQKVEGQNLQYLKKGTSSAESTTLSFWIKSTKTGTYICELFDVDNTRQISKSYTVSASDTWEKKELTFAGDTTGAFDNDNANSLQIHWYLSAGSDFTSGTLSTTWTASTNANRAVGQVDAQDNASNNIYLTGVQFEASPSDTPSDFEFLPFDVQLERCKRYFQKSMPYDDYSNANYSDGYESALTTSNTTTQAYGLRFPTELRTAPTLTLFRIVDGASGQFYRVSDAASVAVTAVQVGAKNVGYFSIPSSDNSYAYNYRADAEL